jgi:putative transposase
MEGWLSMLKAQYNWRLEERIKAYEQCFIQGEYCDIRTKAHKYPYACSLSKGALYGEFFKHDEKKNEYKKRSAFEIQCANLTDLKQQRHWYKRIYSSVLQQSLKQLNEAFNNFFQKDRGFPKFKRRSDYKSFTYPQNVKFDNGFVLLPGIGWMKYHDSRPFPDGFKIKSVTIRKKSTGWYMSVRLEDKSAPEPVMAQASAKTKVLGIDVGIAKLVSLSTGETIANPRFRFSKGTDRRHRIRHRRVSRKTKGSKNKTKTQKVLNKLDESIARKREDYHWKIANQLIKKALDINAEFIAFEDLNIKGMVKRCSPKMENGNYVKNGQAAKCGLNRVILDVGWGELKNKVKSLSLRTGLTVIEVNPKHSSQECSCCGYVSPTNRDKEKFLCESCGHIADADIDAAVVIAQRGLDAVRGDTSKQGKTTPTESSLGKPCEPGNRRSRRKSKDYRAG